MANPEGCWEYHAAAQCCVSPGSAGVSYRYTVVMWDVHSSDVERQLGRGVVVALIGEGCLVLTGSECSKVDTHSKRKGKLERQSHGHQSSYEDRQVRQEG